MKTTTILMDSFGGMAGDKNKTKLCEPWKCFTQEIRGLGQFIVTKRLKYRYLIAVFQIKIVGQLERTSL